MLRLVITAGILISTTALVPAQTFTGTILGAVEDSSGAAIPGARVVARETSTNVQRITTANGLGYYEIPLLPPGLYQLEASHTGFKTSSRSNLKLDTDQKMEIRIVMSPGDVKETVEVRAETPLLQTTGSSVGQVVDNKNVVDLPLSNRNLLQLVNLVAGVNDFGAGAAPATTGSVAFGRWSANGGQTNTNEFMLDGATAILANMNAASIIPAIDAIAEFKIQTNAMSAEYGRTGGAVVNATYKSGTNLPHGTAYDFWKNRVLNANTWLNNRNARPKDFLNVHTFGYSLGGPIEIPKIYNGRNRTFFFTNYEGYRDVIPTRTLLTVPTDPEKAGDFSQRRDRNGALIQIYDPTTAAPLAGAVNRYTRSPFPGNLVPADRMDPVAKKLITYYPAANVAPTDPFTNALNFLSASSARNVQNAWAVKIDHNLGASKRLFGRYSQSAQGGGASNYFGATPGCPECLKPGNPAGAFSARGGGSDLFIYPKNIVLGYTQAISATKLLDVRYSINRQLLSRLPQAGGFDLTSLGFPKQLASSVFYPTFPPISIQNYQGLGTASNGDYLRRGDLTHAVQGSLTLLHGAHTIKTGGDFRLFRYADIQAVDITPSFSFNQSWTQQDNVMANPLAGWSLASFLLGLPASGTSTIPGSIAIQFYYMAGYFQDDWRVNKRLTLNLGFRYEVETPFTERYNRTSYFDTSVKNAATERVPSALGGLQFVGKDNPSRYRNGVDKNNAGPRVGLAYKVTDSIVARAAYGLFFQPSMVYGYGSVAFGGTGFDGTTPMVTTLDAGVTAAGHLNNPFPNGFVQPGGSALGSSTLLGQNIQSQLRDTVAPYSQQYNAGIQYQWKSLLLDVGYVGSHGVHQVINIQMDQLAVDKYQLGAALNQLVPNPFLGLIGIGSFANSTISQGQLLRPFPQFADVQNQFQTRGSMSYNSLQTKVERRFAKGFSMLATFTWSKNIGNVGERYWASTGVVNQYDLRAERALSPLDVPRRFTIAYTWELPFGKGKPFAGSMPFVPNLLFAGWQVNGTTTFAVGQPLAITNAVNQAGFGGGSRPVNNGHSPKLSGAAQTPDQWFDTSVFSQAPPFAFGNVAHFLGDVRGPGVNSWTTSFFKNIAIRERASVQFRAEFFNLLNHPIWAAPGTQIASPTFGRVTSKNGNRTGQLGLKFIF